MAPTAASPGGGRTGSMGGGIGGMGGMAPVAASPSPAPEAQPRSCLAAEAAGAPAPAEAPAEAPEATPSEPGMPSFNLDEAIRRRGRLDVYENRMTGERLSTSHSLSLRLPSLAFACLRLPSLAFASPHRTRFTSSHSLHLTALASFARLVRSTCSLDGA